MDSKGASGESLKSLIGAPEDDEEETEEERQGNMEAEEDIKAGRLIPWEEVKEVRQ